MYLFCFLLSFDLFSKSFFIIFVLLKKIFPKNEIVGFPETIQIKSKTGSTNSFERMSIESLNI